MAGLIGFLILLLYVPVAWRTLGLLEFPDPQTWSWYAIIKDFQTGIGAIIGLVAILSGAMFNAVLNRRREDRIRREEAQSIASVLQGETYELAEALKFQANHLSVLITEAEGRGDDLLRSNRVSQMIDQGRHPPFYKRISSRIGLFPPWFPPKIIRFYTGVLLDEETVTRMSEASERSNVQVRNLARMRDAMLQKANVGFELSRILGEFSKTGQIPSNHRLGSPPPTGPQNPFLVE